MLQAACKLLFVHYLHGYSAYLEAFVTIDTTLVFYPLTFVPDSPDVIIGRKDIDSYAAFPEDGAELLKQLQAGKGPEEAAAWYQERYGEAINLEDFLETLHDLQFLREGGEEEPAVVSKRSSAFWQWVGRAAFSPVAWLVYAAIFAYCVYLILHFPYLRPSYSDLFFSPYLVVLELGLFLGQFPGILFHESFHVLAGQRLGISSRLSIGRRLYFIVFETNLDGLWSVPRQARYLPFFAGMLGDMLWFSFLTIAASWTYNPANPSGILSAFFVAMAFSTVLRFIWQFYFYLQTDIYYVFTNIFRCVDLQQTTSQYIWNRIYRILGHTHKIQDEEEWHPRDKQVARWYVFVFGAGYLFSLGTLLLVGVPAAVRIFTGVIQHLLSHATLDVGFWDTCIFLFLNALQFLVLGALVLREYQARRREKRLAAVAEEHVA